MMEEWVWMKKAEERIVEALKQGLKNMWEEEQAQHLREEGVYYPSAIGACLRKQYYIYTIGEKPSPEKLAIFATGKGVHKAVAEALNASGIVKVEQEEVGTSLKISENITLKGRIDILVVEIDGSKSIVEVKSTSKIPENPHENHLLQIQAYLHATGYERGILLYWDKRKGKVKAFAVKREKEYLHKIAERAILLHEHLKRKVPPLKEAIIEGRQWECDTCEYRSICEPFIIDTIPKNESIVVASLDGVLVDDTERKKLALFLTGLSPEIDPSLIKGQLKQAFLKSYFDPANYVKDSPKTDSIDELWRYRKLGKYIVIISERPEEYYKQTKEELEKMGVPFDALILRPENQPIIKWKRDVLKRLKENYDIYIYLESDRRIAEMIQKMGILVMVPQTRVSTEE